MALNISTEYQEATRTLIVKFVGKLADLNPFELDAIVFKPKYKKAPQKYILDASGVTEYGFGKEDSDAAADFDGQMLVLLTHAERNLLIRNPSQGMNAWLDSDDDGMIRKLFPVEGAAAGSANKNGKK